MTDAKRLRLEEIRVCGGDVPVASVRFRAGLNIIEGASGSGKSFVLDAIDWMLGANTPLRRPPQAINYEHVEINISLSDGPNFMLKRGYGGGNFELTEYGNGREEESTTVRQLSVDSKAKASLSGYLLSHVGLDGKSIRMNADGKKSSLSLREVSHLILVREADIIKRESPFLSKIPNSHTKE